MTSQLKTAVTFDVTGIVDGTAINASDVTTPISAAQTQARLGQLSVSSADTYVKHLEDALLAGTGVTLTKGNAAANETLMIATSPARALVTTPSKPAGASVEIYWGDETFDTANFWAVSPNPERLTIAATGVYAVCATLVISSIAIPHGANIRVGLERNASTLFIDYGDPNGHTAQTFGFSVVLSLTAADYLNLRVWFDSGTPITLDGGQFAIYRIA
jgi:hypothetical protein